MEMILFNAKTGVNSVCELINAELFFYGGDFRLEWNIAIEHVTSIHTNVYHFVFLRTLMLITLFFSTYFSFPSRNILDFLYNYAVERKNINVWQHFISGKILSLAYIKFLFSDNSYNNYLSSCFAF